MLPFVSSLSPTGTRKDDTQQEHLSLTRHASEQLLPALWKVPGSLSGLRSAWLHGSSNEVLPHTCSILKSACGTRNKKRKCCNQAEEGTENPAPPTCCPQGPLRQRL